MNRAMLASLSAALSALAPLGLASPQWSDGPGFRFTEVSPRGSGPGFRSLPPEQTGLVFANTLGARTVAVNRVTENGSGVALGDVDGDGWCDIYFCGLERENALFKNLGNFRFTNITAQAGVACPDQLSTGAVFADTDGDGDLDLLVNSIGGGTRAFFNDGAGRFTEQTGTRLVRRFGSTSLALGDIDLDGDLDLYVANYRTISFDDELPKPKLEARLEGGKIVVSPPGRFHAIPAPNGAAEVFELAERDFLYINTGAGVFAPVSWTNGNFLDERGERLLSAPLDWGLSAMIRDLNGDFLPDIIVCNDFFLSPDQVWLQQPGTRFRQASSKAIAKFSLASMAVDVADVNRDGHDDIFFSEMLSRSLAFRQSHRDNAMKGVFNTRIRDPLFRPEVPRNTFFLNRGDGTYAEIAELAGLDASEWSWGAQFIDVDLDGYEDLIVPTGHNHDVQEADVLRAIRMNRVVDSIPARMANLQRLPKLHTPILAFRNEPPLRFREAQDEWGLGIPGVANGFASGDLDNDGDLDLVFNRVNDAALLLQNEAAAPRIAVRLKGAGQNTRGIGAKIVVRGGAVREQHQTVLAGGRYLSCDEGARVFAAGSSAALSVEVLWPDRSRDLFTNLAPNRIYEFKQAGAAGRSTNAAPAPSWFANVSAALNHRHADPEFDDWSRQPTLPLKLSSQGPALAWTDLNGDGRDDLIVGAGRGQRAAFLLNGGNGFSASTNAPLASAFGDDMAGLLHVPVFGPLSTLLVSVANYESGAAQLPSVHGYSSGQNFYLPGDISTAGALAVSDIDADGDLDLFVAGRVLPGRYPAPASSRVFKNTGGGFILDAENSAALAHCGLVSSACFADLDADGWDDLITPLECGEVRLWKNDAGKFKPFDAGIGRRTGLWTGVAPGDFDNDGRMDFVVGNWGRNTRHERFMSKPLRFYYGDFDGNGVHDVIEAIYDAKARQHVPACSLEMLQQHIPSLAERFQSFAAYAKAGIDALLEGRSAEILEVATLDSTCFLNRGSTFEARPLPIEAQFAPVFGLAVADFDGDGHEDIAAAQNLHDTRWDTGRLDSGRPIVLRGDGRGNFKTVPFAESGLEGSGQGRAVALADYNRDGRIDLAVSQNDGQTLLFENREGQPGLRIKFTGAAANPAAVGARYRLAGEMAGPARQVTCGSGWLAQHSVVQVVPKAWAGKRLLVQWGPNRQSEFNIPLGAREVVVSADGISKIE